MLPVAGIFPVRLWRVGDGPQVMATIRNLAIATMKLAGAAGIAATARHYARSAIRPLATLGLIPAGQTDTTPLRSCKFTTAES